MAPAQAARAEKFFLSACSRYYLKALCDPFSLTTGLACIPDLLDIPSQKLAIKARGTLAAGTTGFGFVAVSPFSCSNGNAVYHTLSTYAGGVVNLAVPLATGVTGSIVTQFPFGVNDITNALAHRTVGCGLRVRYLGTELNRSGRMILLRQPVNSSVEGLSPADALSNNAVPTVEVDRKWKMVFWLPNDQNEYAYVHDYFPLQSGDSGEAYRLVIMVDGTTASNSFEWEVVWHKEYISREPGTFSLPNITPSHSDVQGLSAVRNYFEGAITYIGGDQIYRNAMEWVSNYSPTDVSHVITAGSALWRAYRQM